MVSSIKAQLINWETTKKLEKFEEIKNNRHKGLETKKKRKHIGWSPPSPNVVKINFDGLVQQDKSTSI